MKIKTMRRELWPRVKKKRFYIDDIPAEDGRALRALFGLDEAGVGSERGYYGAWGLLCIDEIAAPLIIKNPRKSVKIVENGYRWVQIALDGEYFWMTAMFSETGELSEVYFDITDGNKLSDRGEPWFADMYLDVVTDSSGAVFVLDRDELDDALRTGDITRDQYDRSVTECEKLYRTLCEKKDEICEFCRRSFKKLKTLEEKDKENTMNDIIKAMKERRSIRNFKPDMPPKDLLEQIAEAGLWAANGRGQQAVITIAVTNKELRDRISDANRRIAGGPEGHDPFYGAPVIFVVLADSERITNVCDGSLVIGNMMLAAHSLGLGSIWIHRAKEEFEQDGFKQILKDLGIEGNWTGVGHCAVGYIYGEAPKAAPRKDGRVFFIE